MTFDTQRWQAWSTAVIILLSIISALIGLFRPDHYPPEFLPGFYIQDALILIIGVPALLLGFTFARVGSIRGRIVWLGALAYMTYMWASIALQVGFNRFFLGYIVLFGVSMYTLIGAMVDTNPLNVRDALTDNISQRYYGGFLWLIAIGLAFLWLSELVPATLSGEPPLLMEELGPQALASHVIDLSAVVPALTIAGIWLWRGRPWGYVTGGVSLVFGAMLAPTLTGMTAVILFEDAFTVPLIAIVLTALPALLAVALAIKFLLSIEGGLVASSEISADRQP